MRRKLNPHRNASKSSIGNKNFQIKKKIINLKKYTKFKTISTDKLNCSVLLGESFFFFFSRHDMIEHKL